MERRSFFKKSAIVAGGIIATNQLKSQPTPVAEKEFYELKVYQLTGSGKAQIKKFYTEAVIPSLNNWGAKVGAFEEYGLEEPPKIYLLHIYQNPAQYYEIAMRLRNDKSYLESAKTYMQTPPTQLIFERYETFLMDAFDAIPNLRVPDKSRGLFELRTYESYNEDAALRKVKMFNAEEIALFDKVGLKSVFFGQILAGPLMPALTYMLSFKDMAEREANWAKFRASDEWNVMRVKEEYVNTVSMVRKKFLIPLDYSQI